MKIKDPNDHTPLDRARWLTYRNQGNYALAAKRAGEFRWRVYTIDSDGIVRPFAGPFWRWITAARIAQEIVLQRNSARWDLMGELDALADRIDTERLRMENEGFLEACRLELDIGRGIPAGVPRAVVRGPNWTFVKALKPSEIFVTAPDYPPVIVDLEALTVRRLEHGN